MLQLLKKDNKGQTILNNFKTHKKLLKNDKYNLCDIICNYWISHIIDNESETISPTDYKHAANQIKLNFPSENEVVDVYIRIYIFSQQ